MTPSKRETDDLIKRIDNLTKSIDHAPSAAARRMVNELDGALEKIETVLSTAWDYCGSNMESDPAFARFMVILQCYERGSFARNIHKK